MVVGVAESTTVNVGHVIGLLHDSLVWGLCVNSKMADRKNCDVTRDRTIRVNG